VSDVPKSNATSSRALGYAFVAPTLLLLIALNVFPLAYTVVLSFQNAYLDGGVSTPAGGANFGRVFSDPRHADSLRTTAVFIFSAVFIELILGFVLALCMKSSFTGKTVVLTVLLVPMMLSPAVMGLYWNLILNGQHGVLNQLLGLLHLPQPLWLTDPNLKLATIVMIDVWMWTPFMMLIALAALNAIPSHIYEAAAIDRASRWYVFRRITLPLCAPLLVLAVLFRATDALKQFDLVMAITGPNDASTQTLSALLYQVIFGNQRVGLGSAYALVVLVAVIALAIVVVRYMDRLQASGRRTT